MNGNQVFLLDLIYGFSSQFSKIIFKMSTFHDEKTLSQEDWKSATLVGKGTKRCSHILIFLLKIITLC